MTKILFFIGHLGDGGAERVLVDMANYWASRGKKIKIVSILKCKPHYKINPNIEIIMLENYSPSDNALSGIYQNINRINSFRKLIKTYSPNILISFSTSCNVIAYFANIGLSSKLVISERTNLSYYSWSYGWKLLIDLAYRKANALVLQTKSIKEDFRKSTKNQFIIPNPINVFSVPNKTVDYSAKIIIAVGRLDSNKNFKMIVEAFAQTNFADRGWQLWIIGRDAGEQASLLHLVESLGIENYVHFLGKKDNIYEYLIQASIFAMASKVEGYPNALLEAMAVGLAPLSTDCKYGPNEIICSGKNGFIVEENNLEVYTHALSKLMGDESLRERIGKNAREIMKTNNIDNIMRLWDNLILTI